MIADVKAPARDWMFDVSPGTVTDGATELIIPAKEPAAGRFEAAMADDKAGITANVDCAEVEITGTTLTELVEETLGAADIVVVKTPAMTVVVCR